MKRIFISGKLDADNAVKYLQNVHEMMCAAEFIKSRGYSVYVPCIDLLMGIKFGYENYNDYFDNSQPWLEVSDAVYVIPGSENSKGTQREIEHAEKNNISVYYNCTDLLKNEKAN